MLIDLTYRYAAAAAGVTFIYGSYIRSIILSVRYYTGGYSTTLTAVRINRSVFTSVAGWQQQQQSMTRKPPKNPEPTGGVWGQQAIRYVRILQIGKGG